MLTLAHLVTLMAHHLKSVNMSAQSLRLGYNTSWQHSDQ